MVRFHWHVEDGMGASIPPGGCSLARPGAGVQHAACDIELPGEGPCQALFTLPANYLSEGGVKDIGIVLGHGDRAEDWRGPLLTGLAEALASAGHLVVRCHSAGRELRRQRVYEKALDAAATSPFARFVQRWVLAGVGHGARLAAIVGCRARGSVAGFALLSYPLAEPLQTAKGPLLPDSSILLLRLQAPALFLHASNDTRAPLQQLRTVAAQMKGAGDVRLAEVPDVDGTFLSGTPPALQPATRAALVGPLLEWVAAVQAGRLAACSVPPAHPPGQAAAALSDQAAAGIAAQVAILEEDDSVVYEVEPFGAGDAGGGAGGAAAAAVTAQQLLAQQLQLQQALQQQQAQQLAAAAAKAGIALPRGPGGGAAFGGLQLPAGVTAAQVAAAAAAAAGGGGGSAGAGAPVMLGGLQAGMLTPQMLAAAQAVAAAQAAAKQQQAQQKQGGS